MIKKLESDNFDAVYEIMENSFPPDERRTYEEQKALLKRPDYHIFIPDLGDDSKVIQGFAAMWQFEEISFIEHLAVDNRLRNLGLGTRMLEDIRKNVSGKICLEVELPDTDMAKRRIAFYQRNGFCYNDYPYMQPAISKGRNPIPLRIMTTGERLCEEEFNYVKDILYKKVYSWE